MSDHFRSFIRISMRYPPMCMIKSLCLYYTISAQIMKDISVRKKRSFFYTVSTCVYCQSSVHYKYNIFFIQSGEMCIELWIYKDFYKISERGTTGAQHPPDVRIRTLLSSRKFLLVAHRIGLSGGDIIPDLCLEIISILIRFPEWPVMRMME